MKNKKIMPSSLCLALSILARAKIENVARCGATKFLTEQIVVTNCKKNFCKEINNLFEVYLIIVSNNTLYA